MSPTPSPGDPGRFLGLTHGTGLSARSPGLDAVIEPAVIDLVLRALPDPVALIESAVRRGRLQHRLQWATPAFSNLARIPHAGADVSDLMKVLPHQCLD